MTACNHVDGRPDRIIPRRWARTGVPPAAQRHVPQLAWQTAPIIAPYFALSQYFARSAQESALTPTDSAVVLSSSQAVFPVVSSSTQAGSGATGSGATGSGHRPQVSLQTGVIRGPYLRRAHRP